MPMASYRMGHDRIATGGHHAALCDGKGDTGPLRLIILPGNAQNTRTDHLRNPCEDAGEPFGILLLVNIGNIVLLLPLAFGVAHVIDIKAEGFCQIVEPVKLELAFHWRLSPSRHPFGGIK